MGIQYTCDGTGKPINGETVKIGIVVERYYCKEAAKIADEFIRERDELHDSIAALWEVSHAKLIAKYKKELNSLPDVPDEE